MAGPDFSDLFEPLVNNEFATVFEGDFEDTVEHVCSRFNIKAQNFKAAYRAFRAGIGWVSGAFNAEISRPNRSDFLRRLFDIEASLSTTLHILVELDNSLPIDEELEFRLLEPPAPLDANIAKLILSIDSFVSQTSEEDVRAAISSMLPVLRRFQETTRGLAAWVQKTSNQRGRRRSDAITQYVELMIRVADHLGIEVTTVGDRADDPYSTPFTELVFAAEVYLPEGMPSGSLAVWSRQLVVRIMDEPRRLISPGSTDGFIRCEAA